MAVPGTPGVPGDPRLPPAPPRLRREPLPGASGVPVPPPPVKREPAGAPPVVEVAEEGISVAVVAPNVGEDPVSADPEVPEEERPEPEPVSEVGAVPALVDWEDPAWVDSPIPARPSEAPEEEDEDDVAVAAATGVSADPRSVTVASPPPVEEQAPIASVPPPREGGDEAVPDAVLPPDVSEEPATVPAEPTGPEPELADLDWAEEPEQVRADPGSLSEVGTAPEWAVAWDNPTGPEPALVEPDWAEAEQAEPESLSQVGADWAEAEPAEPESVSEIGETPALVDWEDPAWMVSPVAAAVPEAPEDEVPVPAPTDVVADPGSVTVAPRPVEEEEPAGPRRPAEALGEEADSRAALPPEAGEDPATLLAAAPDPASEVGATARLVDWEDPAWVVAPTASVEPPAAVAAVESLVTAADGPSSDDAASAVIDEVAPGPEQPQTAWPVEVATSPERREELSAEAGMAPPAAGVGREPAGEAGDPPDGWVTPPRPAAVGESGSAGLEGLPPRRDEPSADPSVEPPAGRAGSGGGVRLAGGRRGRWRGPSRAAGGLAGRAARGASSVERIRPGGAGGAKGTANGCRLAARRGRGAGWRSRPSSLCPMGARRRRWRSRPSSLCPMGARRRRWRSRPSSLCPMGARRRRWRSRPSSLCPMGARRRSRLSALCLMAARRPRIWWRPRRGRQTARSGRRVWRPSGRER